MIDWLIDFLSSINLSIYDSMYPYLWIAYDSILNYYWLLLTSILILNLITNEDGIVIIN